MSQPVKVLLLSSSTLAYSESAGTPSLLDLVRQELAERRPDVDWECLGEVLYVTSTTAERAVRQVRKHQPGVVLFRPTGLAFMHDEVVGRIRERWPRLYDASVSLSEWLRKLAGGQRDGGPGPRGLLFEVPHWLAVQLIGQAPRVRVEAATEYVRETLDSLLALEEADILCRISVGNAESNLEPAEHQRRLSYFASRVREHCARRHVPFADNKDLLESAGLKYVTGADQWHYQADVRRAEAAAIAGDIIRVVEARLRASPA